MGRREEKQKLRAYVYCLNGFVLIELGYVVWLSSLCRFIIIIRIIKIKTSFYEGI